MHKSRDTCAISITGKGGCWDTCATHGLDGWIGCWMSEIEVHELIIEYIERVLRVLKLSLKDDLVFCLFFCLNARPQLCASCQTAWIPHRSA